MTGFERRFKARRAELEALYMELYGDRAMLEGLERSMGEAYAARSMALRRMDALPGTYTDLLTGEAVTLDDVALGPYQYRLCRMD